MNTPKTVKEKVAFILENNQFSRNDDNTLIFLFWMRFDNLSDEKLNKIAEKYEEFSRYLNLETLNLTSTDAIKQARRDLQKEGLYTASSKAVQRRMKKQLERMYSK